MGVVASEVGVANLALAAFGAAPIQTFDDSTPAGRAVAMLYPAVIAGLLSEYPWSFTKLTVQLAQLNATLLSDGMLPQGWEYAYALPGNLIGLPVKVSANARIPDSPQVDYGVEGQILYTNQTAIWIQGQFLVDESQWPPYFVPAAVACLAAELVMPISGNAQQRAALQADAWGSPEEGRAGGKLGMARRADARNQPSKIILRSALIDVRLATISIVPSSVSPIQ